MSAASIIPWSPLPNLAMVLVAWAIGGVHGGRLLGRTTGVNLRAHGSGNIGATNALRAGGWKLGLGVLAFDAIKGALMVWLPTLVFAPTPTGLPEACGAAAVLGHCFSPWQRFSGGKGVAALLGAYLLLSPLSLRWALLAFVLALLATGIVSLATLAATGAMLVAVFATHYDQWPVQVFTVAMAVLVLFMHRTNLRRLMRGQEPRFEKVWLLGWLIRRVRKVVT